MTFLLAALAILSPSPTPEPGATVPELKEKPWVQLGEQRRPGGLVVAWQADRRDLPWVFEYRQRGDWRRATTRVRPIELVGVEPHAVVEASLDRLTPGVPVTYRLLLGSKPAFEGSVMAPKKPGQPTRFAVFGDCGRGTSEQAEVAEQMVAERPDLVMITGDIVYDNGEIAEYRKKFFPYYNSPRVPLLSSSLIVGVPGNHDTLNKDFNESPDSLAYFYYWSQPLNGPITQASDKSAAPFKATDAARAAFLKTAGPNYPRMANFSFDYGDAHWLCVDANRYVDWTDPKLRKWVVDDLRSSRRRWKFVAFHQPGFHSSPTHQAEKQMRQAAELFEDGGADVVFMGHVHNYQRTFPIQVGAKRGKDVAELAKDDWPFDASFDGRRNTRPKGVIYIVDGAGGARIYNPELNGDRTKWQKWQSEYLADFSLSVVDLTPDRFTLEQIDRQGRVRDRFVITKPR